MRASLLASAQAALLWLDARLHVQRPAAHAVDALAGAARATLAARSTLLRAVGEQHAQVAVAALGDAPEVARAARGMLLGRQAEPGGEVPCIRKWLTSPRGGGHHGGGREQADAGDRQQRRARRRLGAPAR